MKTAKTPEQMIAELDGAIMAANVSSGLPQISRLKTIHAEALEVQKAFEYQPGEGRKLRQTRIALARKINSAKRLLKRSLDFDTTMIKLEQLRDASCKLLIEIGDGKLKPGSKELRDRKKAIDKDLTEVRQKIRKA
jgi:hypothetical protein